MRMRPHGAFRSLPSLRRQCEPGRDTVGGHCETHVSARRIAILVGLAGAACNSGRAPGAGSGVLDAAPSSAEAPVPVGGPWVTCYAHFRPAGRPARDVERLGRACGMATGMQLLGSVV